MVVFATPERAEMASTVVAAKPRSTSSCTAASRITRRDRATRGSLGSACSATTSPPSVARYRSYALRYCSVADRGDAQYEVRCGDPDLYVRHDASGSLR